jgi:hypothetical protein
MNRAPEKNSLGAVLSLRRADPAGAGYKTLLIPQNDEMSLIRAMECGVLIYDGDPTFFSDNHLGGGKQPRVSGVIDARFEIASPHNLLRVFLITRGERRHDGEISSSPPPGWPEKYATVISPEARHYRLYAFTASFELKNF